MNETTFNFNDFIINELKEDVYNNKEYDYDDYSTTSSSDIEYTTQE